nr:hypothetical protein [Ktedonobacteraceae bacterium]
MSEHKTGLSNWTAEDKKLYRERRDKGLRGQIGVVTVHRPIKDEQGKEQRVPLGRTVGSLLSRGKSSNTRAYKREQGRVVVKQQRRGSTRGE